MHRFLKIILLMLVLAALAGGTAAWSLFGSSRSAMTFRTTQIKRGDLLATISATGTVEPEEVIDVGAQVAGQILSFGTDASGKPIDYGTHVKKDMILAKIDDSLYAADVASAKAQLEQAKASVQRTTADLEQMQAKLVQAQRDWERAQKLGPSDALAQSAYDGYKAAYETAKANVAVDEANILQAKAAVLQADSTLKRAQRNLDYCTIRSPVDGVIIDRRVNIGQTVISSLNAPSLFLIAKDLSRMQVWVSVNEADVGNIRPGQPATFTVDAFPGQTFKGQVHKVRLNAAMTQNVVTYTVEVTTDNSSGKLLPYLTANVSFEVAHDRDVLLVPNSALRWWPQNDQIAPEFRGKARAISQRSGADDQLQGRGTIWVVNGNFVQPLAVNTKLSDGMMTEIQGDAIPPGTGVVIGEQQKGAAPAGNDATNPFTPQLMRGRRGA